MKPRRSRDRSNERGATPVAADVAPSSRIDATVSPRVRLGVAALMLALVLSALFPEITWQAQIFNAPDFEAPSDFATAGRAAQAAGEYPLWNPHIFLGMPSFGSLTFTPYVFPLSEILRAVGALPGMPPLSWLLFYFWLAGFGMFVLMRALRCGFWPSLLAAVCFMATPHLVSMGIFGHGSKLASVALMPWLLWATLHMRNSARPWMWTAGLSLVLGLEFLRGHPQIAFYALLMLAIWGLVELLTSLREPVERRASVLFVVRLGIAVVLGIGLAAVLLLPVRAYAPESIRGASEDGGTDYTYATNWSQSLSEVTTFFMPSAMGFGEETYVGSMPFTNFPHYLGQAALLFAAAAFFLLRGRWIVFLAALLAVSLAVSFGRNMPLVYNLFYEYMPYFNRFRVPVMILVLFQLGTSVLAGLGCAALFGVKPSFVQWRRAANTRSALAAFVATAIVAGTLLFATLPWSDSIAARLSDSPQLAAATRDAYAAIGRDLLRADGLRVALLLVANGLLVFLVWRRRLPMDLAGGLLVVLLLFDLGAVDRRMVHPENTWPRLPPRVIPPVENRGVAPLIAFLQSQGSAQEAPVRILPARELFQSNQWMSHGISSVGGYHPAKLARPQRLYEANALADPRIHDMLGVQYIVSDVQFSGLGDPVYSGADGFVYASPTVFPRAWLVGRWRRVEFDTCVPALLDPGFQPRVEALVESAPPVDAPAANPVGDATIRAFQANRVELQVQSSTPALLVVSEAYHPDWRARVNGENSPVLAANCVLRAVAVPSGSSTVVFEFVDPALRVGLGITIASIVVVLLLFLLGMRRMPSARRPAEGITEGTA